MGYDPLRWCGLTGRLGCLLSHSRSALSVMCSLALSHTWYAGNSCATASQYLTVSLFQVATGKSAWRACLVAVANTLPLSVPQVQHQPVEHLAAPDSCPGRVALEDNLVSIHGLPFSATTCGCGCLPCSLCDHHTPLPCCCRRCLVLLRLNRPSEADDLSCLVVLSV